MSSPGWDAYLERLGPLGLRVVVRELLDDPSFAELSGLDPRDHPPEMRADLLTDLRAERHDLGGKLLAALDAAEKSASEGESGSGPARWDETTLREELAKLLRAPGPDAALVLHRLARTDSAPITAAEIRAAGELVSAEVLQEETGSQSKRVAKLASDRAAVSELRQQRRELEGRLRQLEVQQRRAVEHAASLEERLSRRVEELSRLRAAERESREEKNRIEREFTRLQKRVEDLNERRAKERTGEITTALKRLTREQRRTASFMDKLHKAASDRNEASKGTVREIARLAGLVDSMLELQEAQARTSAAAQEAILRELSRVRESTSNGSANGAAPNEGKGKSAARETPAVGVFVDVQNMFYGARGRGARLDFEALLESASAGRRLVRAVAYLVETPEIDQSAFIHLLQMKAYEVKRKPLRIRPDRSMKGNWDLEMALDAMSTAEHLDVVVLATGDGDFVPLVRDLKLRGLRTEVYGFTRSSAPDLREAADRFIPIGKKLLRPLKARKSAV